jgi:hypothetical protein
VLERSVKDRRDVDQPLANWWLVTFLISPITFGIYGLILYFKRIGRINRFIERKQRYYSAIVDFTQKYAEARGVLDPVRAHLHDLSVETTEAISSRVKKTSPVWAFILSLVTFGVWGLVVLYRLNRAWYQLSLIEQEFDDKLSQIWIRVGLTRYPLTFNVDHTKKRSFGLNLLLCCATFGIWSLVWDYKIHTDPDNLYREFHGVEDTVLQTVRSA